MAYFSIKKQMLSNPKIEIKSSFKNKFLAVLSWILLASMWIYLIQLYPQLPERIPIHYNSIGHPDSYGSRNNIFILVGIASILQIIFGLMIKHPDQLTYIKKITVVNAASQYRNTINLCEYLRIACIVLFFCIEYQGIQNAINDENLLGHYFVPFVAILFLIPNIYFVYKAAKLV